MLKFLLAVASVLSLAGQPVTIYNSAPPKVQSSTAAVVGEPSTTTYYYWIVAKFTGGDSAPAGPLTLSQSQRSANFSTLRYNRISWTAVTGASSYDLLRTTSSDTPSGACACAVTTALAAVTYDDQATSTSAYTVNTAGTSYARIYLENLSESPPKLKQDVNGTISDVGSGSAMTQGSGITISGLQISADTATMLTRERGQSGADKLCSDSGGDDTYTCTLEYTPATYVTGMCLQLKVTTTNTGAATIDVNSLGAKTIKTASGGTLANGDIVTGSASNTICYDGTDFRMGGGGTAVSVTSPYLVIGGAYYLPFGFAATLPPTSGWTGQDFSTATFTTSGLGGMLNILSTTTSNNIQGQKIAKSSTTVLTGVVQNLYTAGGSYSHCGIGAYDSGSGEFHVISLTGQSGGLTTLEQRWTNATTKSYDGAGIANGSIGMYRITISGGNIVLETTQNGVKWRTLNTRAFTVTDWIFVAGGNSSTTDCQLLSWSAT